MLAAILNDPKLIAAVLGAVAGIISAILTTRSASKVAQLKSQLDNANADKDARRDYEYEARKRLYTECEPLLFSLRELSEDAFFRVKSLARSARNGDISPDGAGWLQPDSYYLQSTAYKLIAPGVVYRLLRRRVTAVDFSVDSSLLFRFEFSKFIYFILSLDFRSAGVEPALRYDPNVPDWKQKRNENPKVYWRQGLPVGRLATAVDTLAVPSGQFERVMDYGEFERAIRTDTNGARSSFAGPFDLLREFHPDSRPVLWRMLLVLALLCRATMDGRRWTTTMEIRATLQEIANSEDFRESLRWREGQSTDDVGDALKTSLELIESGFLDRISAPSGST